MEGDEEHPATLLDLLRTSLVLEQIAPYLPLKSVLALAATSKAFRETLCNVPETFRYLSLSGVKRAILPDTLPETVDRGGNNWRNVRMDENLTPAEFYSGPLLGIFNKLARQSFLRSVQTLVLDGLSVPAELVSHILTDDKFNVRILSIREVRHMNEKTLQLALRHLVRPGRPEGTPRVRGIYCFGPMDSPQPSAKTVKPAGRTRQRQAAVNATNQGVTASLGAQIGATWNQKSHDALQTSLGHADHPWYQPSGRMFRRTPNRDWAAVLQDCQGIIAFDAVLCRGPRHDPSEAVALGTTYLEPAVANVALGPTGCAQCGSIPEGSAVFGQSPSHHLPMLSPPPLRTSTVHQAQRPSPLPSANSSFPKLQVRCSECLNSRWCERCGIWWDENCYTQKVVQAVPREIGTFRDCWGCGQTCARCRAAYIRTCRSCRSEFCLIDNEGSTQTYCDWCNHGGRRTRELY